MEISEILLFGVFKFFIINISYKSMKYKNTKIKFEFLKIKKGMASHKMGAKKPAIREKNIKIIPKKIIKILVKKLTNLPVISVRPNIGTKSNFMLVVNETKLFAVAIITLHILNILIGALTTHHRRNFWGSFIL